jgi:hypothetical protein
MSNPHLKAYHSQPAICPDPVFVIGAPRSGTTVLGMALAKHPCFWASDETFFLFDLFGMGRLEKTFERWSGRPSSSWLRTQGVERGEFFGFLGLGVNALFSSRSQGRRWIDHTPHHGLMADALADMFPGAFFLHILRDGRQVVHSMIHVSRTMTGGEQEQMRKGNFLPPWATDFREACKTWRRDAQAAADFCDRNPERGRTVRHDRLEADPCGTFRHILEFLQAPHDEAPAAYLGSHRINSSFSGRDANAPADRPQNPWEVWDAQQRQVFAEEAGEALARFGFPQAQDAVLTRSEAPAAG